MGSQTSPNGLRYPIGSDTASALAAYFKNMADDTQASLPVYSDTEPTKKPGLLWYAPTSGVLSVCDDSGASWKTLARTAPSWTNITAFPTGVASGGNGGFAPSYAIEASGFVTLRGSVTKSAGWTGADMVLKVGSIPAPASKSTFAVATSWVGLATARVDVQTDGSMIIEATTSATWIALDGIRYSLA